MGHAVGVRLLGTGGVECVGDHIADPRGDLVRRGTRRLVEVDDAEAEAVGGRALGWRVP